MGYKTKLRELKALAGVTLNGLASEHATTKTIMQTHATVGRRQKLFRQLSVCGARPKASGALCSTASLKANSPLA
jgi:hypothetical protein